MKKVAFIIFLFILTKFSFSQTERLQTIFVYNFIKYIEWPEEYKKGDFIIGIMGDSPVIDEFNKLAAEKMYGNQKIVVEKFSTVNDITKCHILFIPATRSDVLTKALLKIETFSTLVITNKEGMAQKGAAINLVTRDNRQKFEMNESNLRRFGLKVNDFLRDLSIKV